jgi:hypothetical protein
VADYYQVQVSGVLRAEQHLHSAEQRLKRLFEMNREWANIKRICTWLNSEVMLAMGVDLKWSDMHSLCYLSVCEKYLLDSWNYYQARTSISV